MGNHKIARCFEKDLDILAKDTPAGASDASIEFSAACDAVIVVLVPEPTSLRMFILS